MSSVETKIDSLSCLTQVKRYKYGRQYFHSDHLDHDTDLALINRLSHAGESKVLNLKKLSIRYLTKQEQSLSKSASRPLRF